MLVFLLYLFSYSKIVFRNINLGCSFRSKSYTSSESIEEHQQIFLRSKKHDFLKMSDTSASNSMQNDTPSSSNKNQNSNRSGESNPSDSTKKVFIHFMILNKNWKCWLLQILCNRHFSMIKLNGKNCNGFVAFFAGGWENVRNERHTPSRFYQMSWEILGRSHYWPDIEKMKLSTKFKKKHTHFNKKKVIQNMQYVIVIYI